jgi:YidC/Oxa1 family membrane protein insertase
MGEDGKRQILTLVVVSTLAAAGWFGYSYFFGEPDATPPPAGGDGQPAQHVQDRSARERLFTIETPELRAKLTNLNGAVRSLQILHPRYRENGSPHQMVTTDQEQYLPLALDPIGVRIPPDAVWEGRQLSPTSVSFTLRTGGFTIVRRIEAGRGPYQLWSTVRIRNDGAKARPIRLRTTVHQYVRLEDQGGGFFSQPSPKAADGICRAADDTVRVEAKELLHAQGYGPNVRFAGVENRYFATIVAAHGDAAERCRMQSTNRGWNAEEEAPDGRLVESVLIHPRVVLAAGQQQTFRTFVYMGPKELGPVRAAGHEIDEIVDLGWFGFIARYLVRILTWLHDNLAGGNWGIAIILLTFLVKLLLYPLTEKSFRSMAKMRLLKPKMDELNELYAEDREKKTAAVMELYRREKINPLGGCLPTLLQLPVWFALYQSLSTNVELYHSPFIPGWLGDLSAPDPYFIMPLILGGLMFVQQRITPTTMDPMQAKVMMYFMPVMITVFMLFLPAGLTVYMVTNSTLGIAQQQWIQHRLKKAEDAAKAKAAAEAAAAAARTEQPDDEPGDGSTLSRTRADSSTSPRAKARAKRRKSSRGRAR